MNTHHMTVVRDGQQVKNIPVTTGKPGFITRSGTKVIMEKVGAMTMDSATVGIPKGNPEYYKRDTKWNMRITWTVAFLHAAPGVIELTPLYDQVPTRLWPKLSRRARLSKPR